MVEIQLGNGAANAHQTFSIQLGDNLIDFRLNYITTQGPAWSLDAYREGELLFAGAMLEPGAVLTEPYALDIGKLVFVGKDVTLDNLGVDNSLVWVP